MLLIIPRFFSQKKKKKKKKEKQKLIIYFFAKTVEELFEYGTDESHIYPNKTDFYMEFS